MSFRKLLLVAFSTTREIDGAQKRVRFEPKSVVDLTSEELDLLDRLTVSTGKLHYREPISEGGAPVATSKPEVVQVSDYAGQDVPMTSKSAEQLKAYLDFWGVKFDDNAKKSELLAAAQANEAGEPDSGL